MDRVEEMLPDPVGKHPVGDRHGEIGFIPGLLTGRPQPGLEAVIIDPPPQVVQHLGPDLLLACMTIYLHFHNVNDHPRMPPHPAESDKPASLRGFHNISTSVEKGHSEGCSQSKGYGALHSDARTDSGRSTTTLQIWGSLAALPQILWTGETGSIAFAGSVEEEGAKA